MALPVTIPNTFANATSSIPLSQLDTNFSTLANAVNGLNSGSETLANLKATTANVGVLTVTGNATIGDASTDTVTLNSTLTANTAVIFAAGTSAAPSITTTGDTNTGIFFPAADTIAFAEGGVEAMRIDSSGNVGIGTSSAGDKLSIESSTNSLGNFIGTRNTSTGTSAGSRLRMGNNASENSFVIDAYGGNHSTKANFVEIINVQSAPLVFGTATTERMRIDSIGNVGIGTSSPGKLLQVGSADGTIRVGGGAGLEIIHSNSGSTVGEIKQLYAASDAGAQFKITSGFTTFHTGTSGTERARITSGGSFVCGGTESAGSFLVDPFSSSVQNVGARNTGGNGALAFKVSSGGSYNEAARILSGGSFCVGKTSDSSGVAGAAMEPTGIINAVVAGNLCYIANRQTNDGTLFSFRQDGTEEGTISVSGNTVSYNGFSGGHWTQLQEGRGYSPEILRGTVMSSIGEMCEWKSVIWTETIKHPAVPAVEAKEAVLDEEGNVVEPAVEAVEGKDAWTETIPHREAYLGNLAVGATFEEDGVTKTVVDDGNERLPKVKISDVVGDKAVYGVFQTWDEVQDMLVTSLGAFVVRIAAGVTVQIGDLLESNGDGCAKVQDDDVIRSKTIGKVTSTTPSATYADGSYTVPAVLYCG